MGSYIAEIQAIAAAAAKIEQVPRLVRRYVRPEQTGHGLLRYTVYLRGGIRVRERESCGRSNG